MAVPPTEESILYLSLYGGLAVQFANPCRDAGCFFTSMVVRNDAAKGSVR